VTKKKTAKKKAVKKTSKGTTAKKDWQLFEKAVAAFLKTLGPESHVTWNYKESDPETKELRQRDVWIETKVYNITIKILISCKRYRTKLHSTHIEAFRGELLSSSAHKGVIYAFAGFGKPAIEKAKKLNISCCRLYQNQPADLPELVIPQYCCHSIISIHIGGDRQKWGISTWDDVFTLTVDRAGEHVPLEKILAQEIEKGQELGVVKAATGEELLPNDWQWGIEIAQEDRPPLQIALVGRWGFYAGDTDATLLSGAYSFTENEFHGTQTGPAIDLQGKNPGPDWTKLQGRPTLPGMRLLVCRVSRDAMPALNDLRSKIIGSLPLPSIEDADRK
jgi:hypothetical protein